MITVFCLPETLFSRDKALPSGQDKEKSFLALLVVGGRKTGRHVAARDWLRTVTMVKYLCVILPALYYMTCLAYGSVLFATTGSVVYSTLYKFDIIRTGLILSIPLLIGNIIGEATAGWFVDWLMYRHARKHGGVRLPESRLNALWLALFLPIGTIINGVCLSHSKSSSWVGAAFGMGISSLGFQVATTVTYTYCTDVSPQSQRQTQQVGKTRKMLTMPRAKSVTSHRVPRSRRSSTWRAMCSVLSCLSTRKFSPARSLLAPVPRPVQLDTDILPLQPPAGG